MTTHANALAPDEAAMFLEIVEASLRVTRREQFFSWLQGSFQYIFPHEVLICGISVSDSEDVHFETFSSIHYAESHARAVTSPRDGVVWRVMSMWQLARHPLMLGVGLPPGDYGSYAVPFADTEANLMETGLHNIAAHGMGGQNGSVSTFFCFSRVPQQSAKAHAHLLELLIPYLHSALVRVSGHNGSVQAGQVSTREREVLQWLKTGKTNKEIAQILRISPNTVKNHVHNILRKLNVQNRRHAAVKSSNFWLIKNQ